MTIKLYDYIGYLWHGKVRYGYVTKIDNGSYTIRDTI